MHKKYIVACAAVLALTGAALSPAHITRRVFAQSNANVVVDLKTYQDMRWRQIGPFRGGRSTAATGVRTQPNVFYMGASGGGVWKTENYGITWLPISDGQFETGSIGSIAVSDSDPNVIYVGTGSEAIRSNVIIGRGVYKSTDAGRTWQNVGLKDAGQIANIKINPKDPNVAFAAAVGNPFAWGPERGVYRTKDGGKSWQKVLFINDQTGAVSVAINWSNPNEVFASAWRTQRRPWTIISGGPAAEGGVYKSTDGGDHWTRSSSGLPEDLIGKVWIDVAQSNPRVLYAQVEAKGTKGGLYRSSDSGATWTLVNNSAALRARPFYFNKVFVDPKNENDVWVSELGLHHSIDGGKTWATVNTPHGDNHIVWMNPDNPRTMIETNDGGANISQDGGRSWSSQLNQPTAELYMVDADEQFPYKLYAPQQDDGVVVIDSLPPSAKGIVDPAQTWFDASGCESGQIRAIPSGKIIYGDCKGEFGRFNVDTGQEQHFWVNPQQRYGKKPSDMLFRFVRQAPIEIDPHNPKVVYHGSQFLHKTTDGGLHWTKISPDVTANTPETASYESGEPISRDMTGEEVYAALYAIRASRLEPGVIWTGSNDGPVYVTKDGGKTWKNVTPKGLPPGGRVHTIEDSPHRKGSAYVSVYRIYFGDFKPYLYMTNDYGEHWTLLTDGNNGIPIDQPMHVVREDPEQEGLLYAGTWYGAYVSFDNGKHFQSLQQNLPGTPVTDLKVHHGDLLASTMGRSFWIMDDVAPLRQIAASVMKKARPQTSNDGQRASRGVARLQADLRPDVVLAAQDKTAASAKPAAKPAAAPMAHQPIKPFDNSGVFLFTPAATYRTHYPAASGRPDWPEYPPDGARIDYYLPRSSGELKLEVLDAAGTVVRTYSSAAAAAAPSGRGGGGRRGAALPSALPMKLGMNRFVWDLRYAGGSASADGEGGGFGGGGPLVPPGTYKARLTAGGATKTESFVVKIDPRYAKDGITTADLVEQTKFALKVRDALAEARQLTQRVRQALDSKSGDQTQLQAVWDRLMNKPGQTAYEDKMWIDQMSNVNREIGIADQKVPASAYDRFNELMKEYASIKADAAKALTKP